MPIELVQALFTILKHCADCGNCKDCPMKNQCGKMPSEW